MAVIETWLTTDLKNTVQVVQLTGNLFSGDNGGNLIGVEIFDNGEPATLTGSVSGYVIRADGETVVVSGTRSGNKVSVVLPQAAYAIVGNVSIVIKLGSTTVGAVSSYIYRSTTDTIVDPGTIIPSVEELIESINNAVESIPADYSDLWESLAKNFNPDKSGGYKKWEYVTYNGDLYRFNQDHTGSWDSSHVTAVSNGNEMTVTRRDFLALSYVYVSDIPQNADINDYTTPGNFRVATAEIARSLDHYPANVGGRLEVMTIAGGNSIFQRVIDTVGREYTRSSSNDGWTSWTPYGFPVITSYAFAQSVQENDDINDYTVPGNYKVETAAIAGTLSHYPSSVGGRLTVMTTIGANSVFQHLVDTSSREYTRSKSNAGWSAWMTTAFSVTSSYAYTEAIPENDDLDNYTIPGNFRISTAAISRTVKNYPSSVGGRVFVMTINGTNSVLQVVIDTEDRMYTRTKSLSGWASWNMVQHDSNRLQKIGARSAYNAIKPIISEQTYNLAFANAPASIDMVNYIGNDQNVHPKVLFFANGFGGHKYWMAYTPYPLSLDKFENPCIAYSDDGYKWKDIPGNPIDDANGIGYYSDTHLVYNGNTLECWYRLIGDESEDPREEILMRKISSDGVTWSEAETVLVNSSGDYSKLLSPAVIYENGKYCMWVVNGSSSPVAIDYYESMSLPTWEKVRTITLTYTDRGSNLYPWHLDAIKENGQYILCVMGRNGTTKGAKWTLFLATSSDNVTYTTPAVVIKGSAGWDEYLYRSSIVKLPDGYRIYYSAGGNGNIESDSVYNRAVWGVGISESATLDEFMGV